MEQVRYDDICVGVVGNGGMSGRRPGRRHRRDELNNQDVQPTIALS
eukprot:SAG11_NODE_769_length_7262_cov_20.934385_2_plen_46_part_00